MPTVTLNGQRMDYVIVGQGEPVVLIGSLTQTLEMSLSLSHVPKLTLAGYRVIAFQDHGSASSIHQLSAYLAGLLDQLNLGPVRVIGYAQGAHIAQELALAHPELVHAAVMMGTWGRLASISKLYCEAYLELYEGMNGLPRSAETLLWLLGQFPPHILSNTQWMQPTISTLLSRPPMFDHSLARRSCLAYLSYDNRLAALSSIAVPCLVIGFELDILAPARLGREVAAAIPGCRYLEIAGAGHSGPFTHTDQVMKHILEFFAEK